MIISYGYAYPSKTVSFAGLTSGDNPYWVAYNQRADDDGAIPKDNEVNACAKSRFLSSIPNYPIS